MTKMNGFKSAITLFSTIVLILTVSSSLANEGKQPSEGSEQVTVSESIKAGEERGLRSYLKDAWDRILSVQISERVCRCVYNQLPGVPSLFGFYNQLPEIPGVTSPKARFLIFGLLSRLDGPWFPVIRDGWKEFRLVTVSVGRSPAKRR